MQHTRIISLIILTLSLQQGCQTTDAYTGKKKVASSTTGAIIGGVAGAILGNQVKGGKHTRRNARLAGASLGALFGGSLGQKMDEEEQALRKELQNTGVSVIRSGEQIILNMPGHVTFATGQSRIKQDFVPVLSSVARVLRRYDETSIEISGHTDSQGSASSNQVLSSQRAQGVALVLRRHGIAQHRIETRGFGESQPIASNRTAEGRQRNRRVELTLAPTAH